MSTLMNKALKHACEALFQAWLESEDPETEKEISALWLRCRKLTPGKVVLVVDLDEPGDTDTDVLPPLFDAAHEEEDMIRDLSFGGSL